MRYFVCVILLVLIKLTLQAQNNKSSLLYDFVRNKQQHGTRFTIEAMFDTSRKRYISGDRIVSHYTSLSVNKQVEDNIFNTQPAGIMLAIPINTHQTYVLVLAEELINNSGDFSFGTINNNINSKTSGDPGLHYRGYIEGDTTSRVHQHL